MSLRQELIKKLTRTPLEHEDRAAVAVLLRGKTWEELEVGCIRRADLGDERWAGQIAFPGGKKESTDVDSVTTAMRETSEEIGLTLNNSEFVGVLERIQARRQGHLLDFYIQPFVFYLERDFTPLLNINEVADFFWFRMSDLQNPNKTVEYSFVREQLTLRLPAIQMFSEPPLWGLTYMMTMDLLEQIKKP